jgi:hypothetical protein
MTYSEARAEGWCDVGGGERDEEEDRQGDYSWASAIFARESSSSLAILDFLCFGCFDFWVLAVWMCFYGRSCKF